MPVYPDIPPAINNSYTPFIPRINGSYEYHVIKMPTSSLLVEYGQYNQHIFSLLDEFDTLEDNWDHDDAKAPSPESIKKARQLVTNLNFLRTNAYHAAPGPNGEVMVSLRSRDRQRQLEFILYPTKSVFIKLPVSGTPEQGFFERTDLENLLAWLR